MADFIEPPGKNLPPPMERPKRSWGFRIPLPLVLLLGGVLCFWAIRKGAEKMTVEAGDRAKEEQAQLRRGPAPKAPLDPAFFLLDPLETARVPTATVWEHPLGSENGALVYNAQSFLTTRHLGDDLNGIGGWNTDLGDPVFASAKGRVLFAGEATEGWGKMVILGHRLPVEGEVGPRFLHTVYAHLDTVDVHLGENLQRGKKLGTVGTADGKYLAHLHFEIRPGLRADPGVGYGDSALGRVSPERWISENSRSPELLIPAPEKAESKKDLEMSFE